MYFGLQIVGKKKVNVACGAPIVAHWARGSIAPVFLPHGTISGEWLAARPGRTTNRNNR
jgi:hypothetical protein